MSAAKSLVFIVSLPYNASSVVDIALTGPAFDMAAEVANRKYRDSLNVSVDYVYNETQRTCDEISSRTTDRISRFHYRKSLLTTCYAVVSTKLPTRADAANGYDSTIVKLKYAQPSQPSPSPSPAQPSPAQPSPAKPQPQPQPQPSPAQPSSARQQH
ncbi:hypothetical protein BV898_15124 [Hypsibius exemplaris]|uniref:Uncharacterized protein n=1 Tax=Hypsibius exemplaris TaxID=2072580 RepID=A0A9X6RJY5_HYPEX|nr:hypothetical protein BV898_15124 [Hypsibius exemplaris]